MIEPSDRERAELPECSAQYMEDLEIENAKLRKEKAALEAAGEQMASCLNTNRHLSEFTNNEDLFSDDDAEALAAWREVAK